MLFNLQENQVIFPCEDKQVNYWARKWGVRAQQLNDAILETGSIKRTVIKSYLEKKGIMFSVSGSVKKIRSHFVQMIERFNEEE